MTQELIDPRAQKEKPSDFDREFLFSIGVVPYDIQGTTELRRERRRDYALMAVAIMQLGSLAVMLIWSFVR